MSGAGPKPPERETYTGERRVTLDLDDARPFDVVRAVVNLRRAGCYDVEARVSSGGTGYHVRGWIDADDATAEDVEVMRLSHGDDVKRTDLDRQHVVKPPQILFSAKGGREAGEWRKDPWQAVDDAMRRGELRP